MIVTDIDRISARPAVVRIAATGNGSGFHDMMESAIAEPHCAGCGAKGVKLYQYDKCRKCLEPELRESQRTIDGYRP